MCFGHLEQHKKFQRTPSLEIYFSFWKSFSSLLQCTYLAWPEIIYYLYLTFIYTLIKMVQISATLFYTFSAVYVDKD